MPFNYNQSDLIEVLCKHTLDEINTGSWRAKEGFWSRILQALKVRDDQRNRHHIHSAWHYKGSSIRSLVTTRIETLQGPPDDSDQCSNYTCADSFNEIYFSRAALEHARNQEDNDPDLHSISKPKSVAEETSQLFENNPQCGVSLETDNAPDCLNSRNVPEIKTNICEDGSVKGTRQVVQSNDHLNPEPETPTLLDSDDDECMHPVTDVALPSSSGQSKNSDKSNRHANWNKLTGTYTFDDAFVNGTTEGVKSSDCLNPPEKSTVQESDDDVCMNADNEDAQPPFTFTLSVDEWESIKPNCQSKWNKLTGNWTDLFSDKICKFRPGCAIVFHRNWVKATNSRKRKGHFFRGEGHCKDVDCCKYKLYIYEDPDTKGVAEVVVQQLGQICHTTELRKRPLTKDRRKITGRDTVSEGVSNTYYNLLNKTDETALDEGNITTCQSKPVLKTLAAETRRAELLHQNVQVELLLTKEILRDEDSESSKIRGYIQFLSWCPLVIIVYTEAQLKIYKEAANAGESNLYFDATGTLVRRIPDQSSIYYYAVVLPHRVKGNAPIPVCEMLSSCQRTSVITLLLQTWRQSLADIGCRNLCPSKIETDFSWALIHGSLMAFNREGIGHYLHKCWEVCNGRVCVTTEQKWTKIHICCSHFIKLVQRKICHHISDKGLQEFVLHVVAALQNVRLLNEAQEIWGHLSGLLNCRSWTPETMEHEEFLKGTIARKGTEDEDLICNLRECFPRVDVNTVVEEGPIRRQSPFVGAFPEVVTRTDANPALVNKFYAPMVEGILRCEYMPLFPMWSGLMLGDLQRHKTGVIDTSIATRDSNALVESWMRIVKHDTLRGRRRMHVGIFVRKMHVVLKGRIKAFRHSLGTKSTNPRKRPINAEDFETAAEVWQRKQSKKRRSKYFNCPSRIPAPKQGNRLRGVCKPGLINVNNTCWLNSALQALKTWLTCGGKSTNEPTLAQRLQDTCQRLREESSKPIRPDLILEFIGNHNALKQVLPIGLQHDTCVFVENVTHALHEVGLFPPVNMTSKFRCTECRLERNVSEQLFILPLALTGTEKGATCIDTCIHHFFTDEVIEKVDCDYCQRKTNHIKSTSLGDVPAVLIIQLKRFGNTDEKLMSKVKLPRSLQMLQYTHCEMPPNESTLTLCAVQCHTGSSISSGHYWTVVPEGNGIVKYDDAKVTNRRKHFLDSKAIQESCYLVHYRIEDRTTVITEDPKTIQIDFPPESVHLNGVSVSKADLDGLLGGAEVPDSIINIYLELLKRRNEKSPVYPTIMTFSTFFYESLARNGLEGVRRWAKKSDISCFDIVIFPIHLPRHWCMVVANMSTHTLCLYDSIGVSRPTVLAKIRQYLEEKLPHVDWTTRSQKAFPLQQNGTDCGVFLCMYAEFVASGRTTGMEQVSSELLRNRIHRQISAMAIDTP